MTDSVLVSGSPVRCDDAECDGSDLGNSVGVCFVVSLCPMSVRTRLLTRAALKTGAGSKTGVNGRRVPGSEATMLPGWEGGLEVNVAAP